MAICLARSHQITLIIPSTYSTHNLKLCLAMRVMNTSLGLQSPMMLKCGVGYSQTNRMTKNVWVTSQMLRMWSYLTFSRLKTISLLAFTLMSKEMCFMIHFQSKSSTTGNSKQKRRKGRKGKERCGALRRRA